MTALALNGLQSLHLLMHYSLFIVLSRLCMKGHLKKKMAIKQISLNSEDKWIFLFSATSQSTCNIPHYEPKPPPSQVHPPPNHPRMPVRALPTMCSAVGPRNIIPIEYLMTSGDKLCTVWCVWLLRLGGWIFTFQRCVFYTGFHCSLSVCYVSGGREHWSVAFS